MYCDVKRLCVHTFSTLAYLLISISFLSPDSMATVSTALRAMSHAKSDLQEGTGKRGEGERGRENLGGK